MQNLGQFGLENCVCFCMYFLCFSFLCLFVCFFFHSWPDLNLRLYPIMHQTYWLHLGRISLVTVCLVVKADLFLVLLSFLHPHICSMHNFFMCRIPFILNLTFCPLALEKYVYVSNPPSNEKKGEDPLQMRKKKKKKSSINISINKINQSTKIKE